MALDVNSGYSDSFAAFVKFARLRDDANDDKAVIDAHENIFGGRKVLAITQSRTDEIHKWIRSDDETTVNNRTRDLFMKAVLEIFGSKKNIPESVKEAMLFCDYNCGKPLSARRILAVQAAIDLDGTARAIAQVQAQERAQAEIDERLESPDTGTRALADGFTRAELKNVARAINYLRAANPGMTETEAYLEVSTPYTKANRLLQYGGNFLKNAANFARGLQLLDDFKAWHDDLRAFYDANHVGLNIDVTNADTPTKLNINSHIANSKNVCVGLETFVFRDLATDPAADLSKTGEALFGVANNAAMRLCNNGHDEHAAGSLVSLPPEKRRIVYAAFDALVGLAGNVNDAKTRQNAALRDRCVKDNLLFIARVVKYSDALAAKMEKGPLTAKDVIKTCFAEKPGRYNLRSLNDMVDGFTATIEARCGEDAVGPVNNIMYMTGCTLKEAIDSYNKSKPIPVLPNMAAYSYALAEHRNGSGAQMKADLTRGANYGVADAEGHFHDEDVLLAQADLRNKLTFPDGETVVVAQFQAGEAAASRAVEKVNALCGKGHTIQANTVAWCLTQSSNCQLNHALDNYGIYANEHVVLDYTLSKNDETGAITIRYSSPKALPIKFSWMTTVAVDGSSVSTPMVIEPPVKRLDAATAKALVAEACNRRGVELDEAKAARAAEIMQQFCTNMPVKNAKLFANFVLTLNLTANKKAKDDDVAADMAASIREWSEFGLGKPGIEVVENTLKENFNEQIDDIVEDAAKPEPRLLQNGDDEIAAQMYADANRGVFVINGQQFDRQPGDVLAPAFKQAIPGKAMRQGVSFIFNQSMPNIFASLMNRAKLGKTGKHPEGHEQKTVDLQGVEKLISRNANNKKYLFVTAVDKEGSPVVYDLKVSEDKRSATLTSTSSYFLTSGAGANPLARYGEASVKFEIKLDLSGEKPVVTDAKLAQSFEI